MDAPAAVLLDGQQLFGFAQAILWTSLRTGAAIMASPMLGSHSLPMRTRLILVLAISCVLAPLLPAPPAAAPDAATVLNIARELTIGVAMGFMLRLAFEAGTLAGELVAQGTGLAFAQMADPTRGGMASGLVGQWFYIAFGLLFFAFDGHLALIQMVATSYTTAPVGTPLANPSLILSAPPQFMVTVFATGTRIALPVMIAMLVINLSFGLLARAAPSLNPIQIGLPTALFVGLMLMGVVTGELMTPVQEIFEAAFREAAGLLG